MNCPEVKKIKNNPSLEGMAALTPDVVFSTVHGTKLTMQILTPWTLKYKEDTRKYPLIVFIQGSGWTFPNVYKQIPQLSWFAESGYVVATITHRNCLEGHPFPAFLEDVKTAIRFLRKNSSVYHIDPERVGIWGTSSGGNAALLAGITGDAKEYKTEEHCQYSDSVKAVVDCFGPTDLMEMMKMSLGSREEEEKFSVIFHNLAGGDAKAGSALLKKMSPFFQVEKGKEYPPFLILQGDKDELVSYNQSFKMYHRLLEAGAEAKMVCIENAPHEDSFWGWELLGMIKEFFDEKL